MPAGRQWLTVRSLPFCKAEYPQAGFIGLFRVLFTLQYLENIQPYILVNGSCPIQEHIRRPVTFKAVGTCHVLFIGGITIRVFIALVQGDTLIIVVDLYGSAGV